MILFYNLSSKKRFLDYLLIPDYVVDSSTIFLTIDLLAVPVCLCACTSYRVSHPWWYIYKIARSTKCVGDPYTPIDRERLRHRGPLVTARLVMRTYRLKHHAHHCHYHCTSNAEVQNFLVFPMFMFQIRVCTALGHTKLC